MADDPVNPFTAPPEPANVVRPERPKARRGWPKGISKQEMAAQKAGKGKEAPKHAVVPQTSSERPQSLTPAAADGPVTVKPYVARQRHRQRPLEEYPADEMVNEKFSIPRSEWPDGFALQWQAVTVAEQPQDASNAAALRVGWEGVCPEDFDGKYAYKVPYSWGRDRPIIIDGLMLVARPMNWHQYAKMRDEREAKAVINLKVNQLSRGELDKITMAPQHKHLHETNFVNASVEVVGRSGETQR